MKKKFILSGLLILALLIQLAVPSYMIFSRENTLKSGQMLRFKTAPIDPSDPFRGKYVVLSFDENSIEDSLAEELEYNEEIFVTLTEDQEGFAKITQISRDMPVEGLFVRANVDYTSYETVYIDYPFNRYYLDEFYAKEAELLYFESQMDTTALTWAEVYISEGMAVLHDVKINDVPIRELVKVKLAEENSDKY